MIRFKSDDGSVFPDWDKVIFSDIVQGKISNGIFNNPQKEGKGKKIINVSD